eukprot:2462333-Prymnesium_polylepis.7
MQTSTGVVELVRWAPSSLRSGHPAGLRFHSCCERKAHRQGQAQRSPHPERTHLHGCQMSCTSPSARSCSQPLCKWMSFATVSY